MTEFVDEDRAAEKEDDEKRGPDVGEEGSEEIHAEQEGGKLGLRIQDFQAREAPRFGVGSEDGRKIGGFKIRNS